MTSPDENNKPNMPDYKMVKLSEKTYKKLCELGRFQESFDDLIFRLIVENEEKQNKTNGSKYHLREDK